MNREVHVRFCEGLGVKFPRATRPLIHTFAPETSAQDLEKKKAEPKHRSVLGKSNCGFLSIHAFPQTMLSIFQFIQGINHFSSFCVRTLVKF